MKFLFCRIAWMEYYQGLRGDKPVGGGSVVDREGIGFEAFNFKAFKGKMYGFCQYPKLYKNGRLNISRIDLINNSNYIDNITAIWFSKNPQNGGQYIIGWYKNARVFRSYQSLPLSTVRIIREWDPKEVIGYSISAQSKDCVILDLDDRVFQIPLGAGWSGQSNVWYCDSGTTAQGNFLKEVEHYIKANTLPPRLRKTPININTYQRDEKRRKEIELTAMKTVARYFSARGYKIRDVHSENLGYDLEASFSGERLLLEVKGLSGSDISVEMTPNELEIMIDYKSIYRVCVITQCLTKRTKVHIFRYSDAKKHWLDRNNSILQIQERIGARLFV